MQKLQTILISILIIVALFTSIYFPYKFKQLSNDFLDQTNQYGELLKQINDLQKEVRELRDGEIEELSTFKSIKEYEGFTVEGNDIYYSDIKAGFIEGDKINVFLESGTFSFVGDLNKMSLFIPHTIIFSYNDLGISEGLYRANSTNSPLNITYKCDGPLKNLENVKYEYCKTNGKDYLTQYEFSDLTSSGFGTGGGTVWRWYKLYIKKINGMDFVFQGHIYDGDNWIDDDNWIDGPSFYSKEDKEKYKRLSTKKYLDGILTNESIIDKIKEWDEFVESL